MGYQDLYPCTDRKANQCWLALVNTTDTVSIVAFLLLAVTSLPSFCRKFYMLFYVIHTPTAWIMLFNAIWHYQTCGLILIPNIIYYLSFNIPPTQRKLWSGGSNGGSQRTAPAMPKRAAH